MSPWPYIELGVLVLLVAVSGFLSLAESALVGARRERLTEQAEAGDRGAATACRLLEQRELLLASLGLLSTLAMVTFALLTADLVLATGDWRPLPLAALLGLLVLLVFGLAAPKSLGVQQADRLAARVAPAVDLLARPLAPIAAGLGAIAGAVVRWVLRPLFGGRAELEPSVLTEEDIRQLAGGEEMDEDEREMIQGVVSFADKVARETMVPRIDMATLPAEARPAEAIELVRQQGHSRIPIYRDTVDNIVGVVYARDVLAALLEGRREVTLESVMRPAYFVPESKKVDDLLREMQQRQVHMAIVIDEYGGTAGLVTIEDLLEEIFGEIRDEYDQAEQPELVMLDEDTARVDGRLSVDEVEAAFEVDLPEGDFDSIGGLVLGQLGRLPQPGERLAVNGLDIVVEHVGRHRIGTLRIRRRIAAEEEG